VPRPPKKELAYGRDAEAHLSNNPVRGSTLPSA
jgi:hypothetical protein